MSAPPLRIAFFVDVFPRIENTFILNQMTGLLDRGHQLDIFAMGIGDTQNVQPDVVAYRLLEKNRYIPFPTAKPQRLLKALRLLTDRRNWHPATWDSLRIARHGARARSLSQLYTTLSFLRAEPYDIVHCQFGYLGPIIVPLIKQGIITGKVVTSFRGADLTKVLAAQPQLYDELLEHGDLFLAVSDYFKERLIGLGCDPAKVLVHRSGIDLSQFSYLERQRPTAAFKLLFVGRLTELKGTFDALTALKQARAAGCDITLTMLGDGELRGQIEQFIRQHKLHEVVTLLGFQPRTVVIEHLKRAHALIAPSVTGTTGVQEGIPNVLKEAMAMGLPVLSTWHSAIPELVEDGVSGLLAPEHDVDKLTENLCYLYNHPEAGVALGRAGRRKVEREYDMHALNDELIEIYRKLLGHVAESERIVAG